MIEDADFNSNESNFVGWSAEIEIIVRQSPKSKIKTGGPLLQKQI